MFKSEKKKAENNKRSLITEVENYDLLRFDIWYGVFKKLIIYASKKKKKIQVEILLNPRNYDPAIHFSVTYTLIIFQRQK